jgi:metal-responsive CopG/Arc/MetJ family transcriptional regulator
MASSTTKATTLRLKNEDIDAIDAMAELIGKDRSETIRIMLRPQIIQAKVAMETKSTAKASMARMQAELEHTRLVKKLAKLSDVQTELFTTHDEKYVVLPA